MTRFFSNANYDFIALRKYAYMLTALFIVPGLLFLLVRGLNYSIEFTGGTMIQVKSAAPVDVGALRSGLDRAGIHGAEIQSFGGANEYLIRARVAKAGVDPNDTQAAVREVSGALDQVLGEGKYSIERREAVSPKVGSELRTKALLAIFLSFFAVLAYLAVRFEWRFGVAAIVATAHDIIATVAFIAIMRIEVSLMVVAAVLSMVGYSMNDTIVIFDRVRENLIRMKGESFAHVLNRSVNETLPRSILTHGTSLATLLAIAIFGGEVIRPFALVMFFGVFTGTFSSIYIASPVLMAIEARWPGPHARARRAKAGPSGGAARKVQPVA